MESAGDQINMRPIRESGSLTQEHGIWVFHAGQPLSASVTDDILQQLRDERDQANFGNGK